MNLLKIKDKEHSWIYGISGHAVSCSALLVKDLPELERLCKTVYIYVYACIVKHIAVSLAHGRSYGDHYDSCL